MRKIDPKAYRPLGYRVLVRDDPVEEKIGSIIITDETKEADGHAIRFGTVVAMGELAFTMGSPPVEIPGGARVGDTIHFSKYGGAGNAFEEDGDGNKYRLLNDEDIIGVLT